MKSSYTSFNYEASVSRIDEILNTSDTSFEEVTSIPSSDRLTFTNGFYANCSALFIDMRGSSSLPDKYRRPTLARIYRAYISEAVAIMNGNESCSEIMIVGDSVSAVFDTPYKPDIDGVFETAGQLNSMVKTLNCRLEKKGIDPIRAGIGMEWGRALMIKAGHKGSAVNEIVWMGAVVNRAAKLCSLGAKSAWDPPIVVGTDFASNLKAEYQGFLNYNSTGYYTADVVNALMDAWYDENCA